MHGFCKLCFGEEFGSRSSPLTRGGCLAAYARSIAARAGFVVPAGQRGNAGQPNVWLLSHMIAAISARWMQIAIDRINLVTKGERAGRPLWYTYYNWEDYRLF